MYTTKNCIANITARIDARYIRTDELSSAGDNVNSHTVLETGAFTPALDALYRERVTITDGNTENLDVGTLFVDSWGDNVVMETFSAVLFVNRTQTTGHNVLLSLPALISEGGLLTLGPGGTFLAVSPVDGWAQYLVSLTADGGDVEVDVVFLGHAYSA